MIEDRKAELLRTLPSVDEVLRSNEIKDMLDAYPRELVVASIREALERVRNQLLADDGTAGEKTRACHIAEMAGDVLESLALRLRPNLRRVINGTGVVLHTNLGRAVLPAGAIEAVHMAASGYCNIEMNLASGKRGSRYAVVEELLRSLTGAESCLVVNNNAAAVLLALSSLARSREVIVSRGQLVEIGGSFRIPEVMAQSGAILVEVGATNKTHPDDYRRAITENTALLLHVHMSNYRIVGFTRETTVEEMVEIGREKGLPVMSDLGSGFLVDMARFGLPPEPTVQQVLAAGADVVTFSGDKLLGGPQAGIIVGRREFIDEMKKNPLTRAVRIDKMTIAALEATLREYLDPEAAVRNVPTLRMLSAEANDLMKRAGELLILLQEASREKAVITLEAGTSAVGGGAMPTAELPGGIVAINPLTISVSELASRLRKGDPAVIGRLQEDRLLIDVRTIQKGEDMILAGAIAAALDSRGDRF
ncbi:MAG: selenocysteine synthase [Peptococcaceae bacterium BRH_c4b]|nr:MAG: selenocysteine synthase [Peptococcaceae bacterium BRH_c4b]